ncbi:NAD(P)-dependent alcohol dehydrogenase [Olivibacter sp. CPCC 100613]|uniref:zinc-dependent alcohol dehydrogenase family protein n=1 Tax=Olivibacter sp. CPCC 100613 TaxID=3079931 RepID=UPI002FF9EFBD
MGDHKMKSWQLDGIGRAQLVWREATIPQPKSGEVLVKVSAVSLNYRDKMVIETGRGLPIQFPFTPGSDLAGTVVGLGKDATRFGIGDRVIAAFTPDWVDGARPGDAQTPAYRTLGGFYPGVLAQYVVFSEDWFVHAPESLRDVEACTLPCSGLTAWFALVERGEIRPGKTVLIEGTGGVALFGVQIAKMCGAEVIVSGTADKLERARMVGADHVINRQVEDLAEGVHRITQNRGADHILELVGGAHLGKAAAAVAVGGTISLIGALEGFEISSPIMPLLFKDVKIQGIGTGHRRALERLVRAIDQHKIKPIIDTCYSITDLPLALDHLDRGPFGKIVMEV